VFETIPPPGPVTADDLAAAARLAVTTLRTAAEPAWSGHAGTTDWDCWETVEHVADGLFGYAAQLAPAEPPQADYVPLAWSREKPGGPPNAVRADRSAGAEGLLRVLEAGAGLLAAVVRTRTPQTRAFHVWGLADPEGFAAMGVAEILLHVDDVCQGLGLPWEPPADLCHRTLARLFPGTPPDPAPWPALLWSTARTDLPGRPRPAAWQWHSAPTA